MEWSEVKDPAGEFIFSQKAWESIKDSWLPEEIQEKINKVGVIETIREVNNWYSKEAKLHKPLLLSHIDGQKAVVARSEKLS